MLTLTGFGQNVVPEWRVVTEGVGDATKFFAPYSKFVFRKLILPKRMSQSLPRG